MTSEMKDVTKDMTEDVIEMPKKPTYLQLLQHGVEKELPSGLVVRLRPIDAGMLLTDDSIPDSLMAVVRKQLLGIQEGKDEEEVKAEAAETVKEGSAQDTITLYADLRKYGEIVARKAVIYPKIVASAQSTDEMEIGWFETNDLIALGGIVGRPLKDLESFVFLTFKDVEPVQSGESNLPVAKSGDQSGTVVEEPVTGNVADHELVGQLSI